MTDVANATLVVAAVTFATILCDWYAVWRIAIAAGVAGFAEHETLCHLLLASPERITDATKKRVRPGGRCLYGFGTFVQSAVEIL